MPRPSNTKLTWKAVLEIRASQESSYKIADRYGVTPSLIRTVRQGLVWKREPACSTSS